MRIVFLCRDSIEAKYISQVLWEKSLEHTIIVEKGNTAKRKKLIKTFRDLKAWKYPMKILDVITIFFYSRITTYYMKQKLLKLCRKLSYAEPSNKYFVQDANNNNCLRLLRNESPDVLLVMGTSILESKILNVVGQYALNIHRGVLPYYRNVHSEFWAFYNGDYNRIGSAIIHLDEGIDSGDIALQETIKINSTDNLLTIKFRNFLLSVDLVVKALRQAEKRNLPRKEQNETDVGFYPSPGLLDFYKVAIKRLNSH